MSVQNSELIIDDSNYLAQHVQEPVVNGEMVSRGLIPRDFSAMPQGSIPYAAKFDLPLIPRSEWTGRIKAMEETKTRLSDIWHTAGLNALDQNGTNYCWCYGVVSAMLAVRAMNGMPYAALSAASAAAQIKKFNNYGGWGGEALKWIAEHGVAEEQYWPQNQIKRSLVTPEMKANALKHRITEWYDLDPDNFDQQMTCAFLRIPVAVGYNWWSHEVCQLDPVEIEPGSYGIRIVNSWSPNWGTKGMAVLRESKADADDAVAPRVVRPAG